VPRIGQAPLRRSDIKWSQLDALLVEKQLLEAPRTIEDALDKWLQEYVPYLSCAENYSGKAEHLRPLIVGKPLSDGPTIPSLMRRTWPKLKPATINRRLAILRRILNLAFDEWHWLEQPLGKKIKLLREDNKRHYYLTRAQVEMLAMRCANRHVANLIVFSAFTGLRKSEMYRATKHHVIDGVLHIPPHTKNGAPRCIPLHPRALAIALELPYPIKEPELRKHWEDARTACSLDHIHWHDLRHTFASWLLQKDASLSEVQDLLGHSTPGQTRRYAHLAHANLRGAIDRL